MHRKPATVIEVTKGRGGLLKLFSIAFADCFRVKFCRFILTI